MSWSLFLKTNLYQACSRKATLTPRVLQTLGPRGPPTHSPSQLAPFTHLAPEVPVGEAISSQQEAFLQLSYRDIRGEVLVWKGPQQDWESKIVSLEV